MKKDEMELQYNGRPISELSREELLEVIDDLYRIVKRHQMRRDEEILGRKNVSVA